MKIALVVDDFALNFGHGRYTVELARRIKAHAEVRIYANSFRVPEETGVAFHHVPAWRTTAITTSLSFMLSAESALRKDRPDLVHAQGMNCWQADVITGHMCNAAKYQALPHQGLRQKLFPWLMIPLERRFFRQRRAKHLIAVSNQLAKDIRQHYGWSKPLSVIYHGTDTSEFRPVSSTEERQQARERYGLKLDQWVWLFMGEGVKGLRQVIEQLPHFAAATLLVISRSDFTPYRAISEGLGVAPRVRFWGVESCPRLAFQAADLFVYPSGYDPFGLVVSEAMACGLPVIAGKTIGAAEWIEHGINGLLCDPNDADSIRDQIAWVKAEPAQSRATGLAGRRTVEKHTWDLCAEKTLAAYESVIRERGGGLKKAGD